MATTHAHPDEKKVEDEKKDKGDETPTEKAYRKARESEEEQKKKGPAKTKGQIDAERAEGGEEVPEGERGKPNDARRWEAAERERQERADSERFRAEYNAKRAERDVERGKKEEKAHATAAK